ncbi:hydrogenase-4 component B [Caldanaerovirga acetigignens]|jgi:hydrogenase-4 component B|uniref:Hydrogenase-4 component B n=1 Tax=Caldanaerovirga acetigignens TaxID=447595 RepID=A0A1M7JJT6_9FIRM|nr:complex I subunit 5 family protein [Caldanaerovirga acetigignens]SHM53033.1 hydrogenase-4 component B [Caldanaerovirga acetigignens]
MGSLNLLLILILPIVGVLVVWFTSKRNDNIINTFIALLCGICVLIALLTPSGDLFSISTGFHSVRFILGNINRIFLLFSTSIWCLTALFLTGYIRYMENRARFLSFFMLTLWSVICVFLAGDLLTFYFFFELMALFSYFLVIHQESIEALSSGNLYIFTAFVGGLAVLSAVMIMYSEGGTFEFEKLNFVIEHGGLKGCLALGLLITGFAIKAGCLPFHFWLPRAHPVAPAPASALLSGVLVKSGVFGIMQILRYTSLPYLGLVLMILGSLSTLYGGFMALCDNYPKRLLAYGTISQIGYIFISIGAMNLAGVHTSIAPYLHIYAHGLSKTAMFLIIGYIYLKTYEMRQIKNLTLVPLVAIVFGGLNLVGFPGFIGYTAKVLTKDLLARLSNQGMFFQWVEVIFRLSGILTAAYMAKLFFYFCELYLNRREEISLSTIKEFNIMIFVLCLLVFLTIGIGLLPIVASMVEINLYSPAKISASLLDIITGTIVYLKLKGYIKRPALIPRLSYRKTTSKLVDYFNYLVQMCINIPASIDISVALFGTFIPLLYLLLIL